MKKIHGGRVFARLMKMSMLFIFVATVGFGCQSIRPSGRPDLTYELTYRDQKEEPKQIKLAENLPDEGQPQIVGGPPTEKVKTRAEEPSGSDVHLEKKWPMNGLKKQFIQYWQYRFAGETKVIFQLEAPHIQAMVDFVGYHDYMKGAALNDLKEIEIVDIEKKKDFYYVVKMYYRFLTNGGDPKEVYDEDRWVQVGGKWYHVLYDPFLFDDVS